MGATNQTTYYNLSQFIATDKPAWLQDYNGDMAKIDAGIKGALTAAESAQSTATGASTDITQLASDVTALQTTVSGHTSDIGDLAGDVNTIESLIGNGTPTTTDQTIIGAINEINSNLNNVPKLKSASVRVTAASGVAPSSIPVSVNMLFAISDTNGRFVSGIFKTGGGTWDFYICNTSNSGVNETVDVTYYYLE